MSPTSNDQKAAATTGGTGGVSTKSAGAKQGSGAGGGTKGGNGLGGSAGSGDGAGSKKSAKYTKGQALKDMVFLDTFGYPSSM